MLSRDFFARSVDDVAPDLIGATLLFDGVGGRIVEVEAYDREDPASHTYRGRTPRNATMFGPAGHAYVYRSYGIHWCLNLVCGGDDDAEAVLIRALEPTAGIEAQQQRRRVTALRALCSGPGKLCQALAITGEHDGLALDAPPFQLTERTEKPEISTGPRIGITQGIELSRRYLETGSLFLSRPAPRATGSPPFSRARRSI
ncbi:MAG: DNA-3-methyladenine glycosylase [Gaiellaceae bacterium]|jgi:DNA-3-methyladenine glycosylase|nr:DNA-3-methyladenine glycosylase [Gaiellaceae bacterium]MDX6435228.1 DNA-3-methyladenine glycosylase [Gaiellaceae bacterium]